MRERFKFRAWHKAANEMMGHDHYQRPTVSDIFKWEEEGQPVKIMQWTGCKDRNGVDIYEGDVLQHPPYRPSRIGRFVVEYRGCIFVGICDGAEECARSVSDMSYSHEVIGNIYENPDLIDEA